MIRILQSLCGFMDLKNDFEKLSLMFNLVIRLTENIRIPIQLLSIFENLLSKNHLVSEVFKQKIPPYLIWYVDLLMHG